MARSKFKDNIWKKAGNLKILVVVKKFHLLFGEIFNKTGCYEGIEVVTFGSRPLNFQYVNKIDAKIFCAKQSLFGFCLAG